MRFFILLLTTLPLAACINNGNARQISSSMKRYVTAASALNIRDKPSMEGQIISTIPHGEPVVVFEEKDGWSRISPSMEDTSWGEWVSSRYLSDVRPSKKQSSVKATPRRAKIKPLARMLKGNINPSRFPMATNEMIDAIARSVVKGKIGLTKTDPGSLPMTSYAVRVPSRVRCLLMVQGAIGKYTSKEPENVGANIGIDLYYELPNRRSIMVACSSDNVALITSMFDANRQ